MNALTRNNFSDKVLPLLVLATVIVDTTLVHLTINSVTHKALASAAVAVTVGIILLALPMVAGKEWARRRRKMAAALLAASALIVLSIFSIRIFTGTIEIPDDNSGSAESIASSVDSVWASQDTTADEAHSSESANDPDNLDLGMVNMTFSVLMLALLSATILLGFLHSHERERSAIRYTDEQILPSFQEDTPSSKRLN